MEDILKSIKAQLYERAISPLTGSFIIAWCLWNYKFVLVLFSGLSIPDKFEWIECELFDTWQEVWLLGLLYPLLSTAVYLFIYPFIAKPVFKFVRGKQIDMMNDKKRIDGGALLTEKQSQALYSKIDQLEEDQQKIIDRKDREIERRDEQIKQHSADMLKAEEDKKSAVDELTKLKQTALTKKNRSALHALTKDEENKPQEKSLLELAASHSTKAKVVEKERLSREQVKILKAIGENMSSEFFITDLAVDLSMPRIPTEHGVDILLEKGFVQVTGNGNLSITKEARRYLMENKLSD